MNERIKQLEEQAFDDVWDLNNTSIGPSTHFRPDGFEERFAELIVRECIGILETEIELVKGYKSTAHNDFDVRWHDGKITHFTKLIEKSKKHFGVEE